jgi:hypothetical protein
MKFWKTASVFALLEQTYIAKSIMSVFATPQQLECVLVRPGA